MRLDSEDIENGQISLKRLSDFLRQGIPIFSQYASYFSLFSASLSEAVTVVNDVRAEREFLFKLLTAMMLDNGIYDYTINMETFNSIMGYGLVVESSPESMNVSIEFPGFKEVEEENDVNDA